MIMQVSAGRASTPRAGLLDVNYVNGGAKPGQLFAPSPRLADFGLKSLGSLYDTGGSMVVVTFGVVLTALALFGLAVSWRRHSTRLLAAAWAACAALSLGSALWIGSHPYIPLAEALNGVRLSRLLPYTWFVRIPGMSSFREANRFTELGLLAAALLAGAAVSWLRGHARWLLIPVLAAD